MNTQEQIETYITNQPEPKRSDMQALLHMIRQVMPIYKLWLLDGKTLKIKRLLTRVLDRKFVP
ncbi:hypothetical protein [Spirosoma sp.]|uniref:hypothetical protein n=1 Tax=Spirosoma sp. TaxID=1899569 RepID=UPI003B3AB33A